MWKEDLRINLLSCSSNFIDAEVKEDDIDNLWRFTVVYGFPEEMIKDKTCSLLKRLKGCSESDLPWLCAGDFNEVLYSTEKKGGAPICFLKLQMFRDTFDFCGLQDLEFEGYPFTFDVQPFFALKKHGAKTQFVKKILRNVGLEVLSKIIYLRFIIALRMRISWVLRA